MMVQGNRMVFRIRTTAGEAGVNYSVLDIAEYAYGSRRQTQCIFGIGERLGSMRRE